jgi:hypothetical protein
MEMIATTTIHMDWTPFLVISSLFKIHYFLKDVSFPSNLNQKQHGMFMLAGHMLLTHDNLTMVEFFFA